MYVQLEQLFMQIMVSFEKVSGHNFFKLSLKSYTFLWFVYLKFYADHLFAVHVMRIINKRCKSFS